MLGRLAVGAIPKALALQSSGSGAPERAWVHNAIDSSVSVVDVSDPANPAELTRIAMEDPTDPDMDSRSTLVQYALALYQTAGLFNRVEDTASEKRALELSLRFRADENEAAIHADAKRGLGISTPLNGFGRRARARIEKIDGL